MATINSVTSNVASLDSLQPSLETSSKKQSVDAAVAQVATTESDVNPAELSAARAQLQTALNPSGKPELQVDYLSGLKVTTVRSNSTGELLYQIPDSKVVALARLLHDGGSLTSLGMHTKV